MLIEPIAHFRSPFGTKFGIPRQAGLAEDVEGEIVFEPAYRNRDALRGLERFDYLWIIWEFSANGKNDRNFQATVRPPRLGGNERTGVFASRSPFRPNRLGLSSVRIRGIDLERHDSDGKSIGPVIKVSGADLMDGTPVYDIKPYVTYADSHPEAASGFVDGKEWEKLEVILPEGLDLKGLDREIIRQVLEQDPRPQFHDDPAKVYGMLFGSHDIRFKVEGKTLTVIEII